MRGKPLALSILKYPPPLLFQAGPGPLTPSPFLSSWALSSPPLPCSECSGNIGAFGLCLGGGLAFRAALASPHIRAAACHFPTDIHNRGLGPQVTWPVPSTLQAPLPNITASLRPSLPFPSPGWTAAAKGSQTLYRQHRGAPWRGHASVGNSGVLERPC